jgi:hypothetical protein
VFPFVPSTIYFFWVGVIPVLPSSPARYVIFVHSPSDAFDVSFRLEDSIWSRIPFVWLCYRYSMGIQSYGQTCTV